MSRKANKKSAEQDKKTAAEKTEQTSAPESEGTSPPPKNLYEKEIERYRVFLQHGFDVAYKYYGFTLFHSLSNEEKVDIMQKLGFEPKNPEDFYNLGCLAAQNNDFNQARKYFEKTIELAADFEEAYFNLAMTHESLGNEKAAIENWEIYSEFLDEDSSEAIHISQHIDEIKSGKLETKPKDSDKES